MSSGNPSLDKLYKKYLENRISPAELEELLVYFEDSDSEELSLVIRRAFDEQGNEATVESDLATDQIYQRIREEIDRASRQKRLPQTPLLAHWRSIWKYAAVIALVIAAGVGVFYRPGTDEASHVSVQNDVAPGDNHAVLTLPDGVTIDLDRVAVGSLLERVNTAIKKTSSGTLEYASGGVALNYAGAGEPVIHKISTPLGGQYTVSLPDGSTVRLNAGSSLTYPVAFGDGERRVQLTGEGFFEVARNAGKPFVVESLGQEVEVLGTHFNINAYEDEKSVKTTLVEGSVRVTALKDGETRVLQPGQQSQVTTNSLNIIAIDTAMATAWKNGLFVFHNATVKDMFRQLKRWYQIDVDTAGLPDERFYGEISRNVRLSEVLDMIESTSSLRFRIEGRRVVMQ